MSHATSLTHRLLRPAIVAAAVALGLGLTAAAPASAQHFHGPRVHFGFAFGGPAFWGPPYYPYYAYPPAYYYPPAVVVPSQPPTYIERSEAAPAPSAQDYWYFCADTKAYYPYVKDCPGGWQRVAPRPG